MVSIAPARCHSIHFDQRLETIPQSTTKGACRLPFALSVPIFDGNKRSNSRSPRRGRECTGLPLIPPP
jgi:hypothetical protein